MPIIAINTTVLHRTETNRMLDEKAVASRAVADRLCLELKTVSAVAAVVVTTEQTQEVQKRVESLELATVVLQSFEVVENVASWPLQRHGLQS